MPQWLVTGGTGSFGRAFIQTVLKERPDVTLVSVSRNAEARYRLEQTDTSGRLVVAPGDVRQSSDLRALASLGPFENVIHAAAEKHIGTGQRYAAYVESVNYEGTVNVVRFANQVGAKRVLMLSTDKACAPVNIYGQQKARAEHFVVTSNIAPRMLGGTSFSVVRYGNVAASSGSVIPLFFRQRESGRLTVTDKRMTRFWMPLADDPFCDVSILQEPDSTPAMSAVRWVLLALEHMRGGEIFVPEIPSARVSDVAEAIAPGAELVEIGIRDGEKLAEDLISAKEGGMTVRVPFGGWAILPFWTREEDIPRDWASTDVGFRYRSDMDPQPVCLGALGGRE